MNENVFPNGAADADRQVLPADAGALAGRAWEMIENGRYQPLRIKGSCVGRELG